MEGTAPKALHQCDRTSWACKLGLCKLCNAGLATVQQDERWGEPYVRVHFTVQGGVDLSIKKTPSKHQRMPSHEALLKVAKQHKLPAPTLGGSALAPHTEQAQPFRQQQQSTAATAAPHQRPQQAAGQSPAAAGRRAAPALMLGRRGSGGFDSASKLWVGAAVVGPADATTLQQQAAAEAAYGENWLARKERVQVTSLHGRRPGWDLRCVIVKTGDDCRQELLAMQLIRAFHEIFVEAQLPLWLKPYEVLPTSNRTALIDMVSNTPSIHAIKSKSPPATRQRLPLLQECVLNGIL